MTNKRRGQNLARWVLRLGGTLAFLWFVLHRIDITAAAQALAAANGRLVALAVVALFPAMMTLWARRWQALLRAFGVGYPLRRLLRLNLIGLFLGFVVADSVGGFAKLAYMRADGVSVPRAFAATFVDKALELAMLLAFGLTGFAVFPGLAQGAGWGLLIALGVGVVAAVSLWAARWPLLAWCSRWLARLLSRRVARYLDEAPGQVAAALRDISARGWLHLLALSVSIRLAHFAMAYVLALALRIPIGYGQIVAVMSIVGIALAIPLSVGGLGTREATLLVLFGLLGLAAEQAVALALLLLVYQLPWRALGLLLWWRNPLGARRTLSPASPAL